jgi:hemoglobin/transferrin/lactoferrin receptor protein
MRNYVIILLFVTFGNIKSFAQSITVIDIKTLEPIAGTIISDTNQSKYVITDNLGKANINHLLKDNKTLLIQHNYFKSLKINIDTLDTKNLTVKLTEITFQLGQYTVVANKWEQNSTEIPFSIQNIDPKEAHFSNPQSTPDMLGASSNVFIQKSQMGGGSPMIRGFAANSVLIVVDGVRMNNAIFRSGNLQNSLNIDPNSLGHTEVIFGPGSVTYGSDALGGVMDFHTKDANFSSSGKFETEAEGFYRLSSANMEKTISFDIDFKWKKFSSHTQFLNSSFSNLRAGKNHFGNYPDFGKREYIVDPMPDAMDSMVLVEQTNLMIPSLYKIWNLNQKFRYQPNKNLDFTYSFIYSTTSNIPRYDRLTQWKDNHLKYAEWYYGPQKWMMHNFRIRLFKPSRFYDSAKLILAYQQFEESRNDRKYRNEFFRHRTELVDLYTFNIDFSKELNKKTNLYYGLDLGFNNVFSSGYSENITKGDIVNIQTRYPNEYNYYFSSGIYTNLKYKISPSLNLLTGIRYSIIYLNSAFDNTTNLLPFNTIKLFNQAPNGSIGITWIPSKNTKLYSNLSTGFRSPNLDDIAKVFDSEPGSVVVPNEKLKPEYVYSTEIGASKTINNIVQIQLSIFASYVDNIIVRRDYTYMNKDSIIYDGSLSKVQAMQNASFAKIYGTSLGIKFKISDNINLSSNYNIIKGLDSDGNSLQHVSPDFGNTKLSFRNRVFKLTLFSNYSMGIPFEKLAPSEQAKTNIYSPDGSPRWFTLNFQSDFKIYKQLHLNFSVQNILDRFYIPYSSGIAAPGRNFILGIRLYPF